jgi:hypothetical protein
MHPSAARVLALLPTTATVAVAGMCVPQASGLAVPCLLAGGAGYSLGYSEGVGSSRCTALSSSSSCACCSYRSSWVPVLLACCVPSGCTWWVPCAGSCHPLCLACCALAVWRLWVPCACCCCCCCSFDGWPALLLQQRCCCSCVVHYAEPADESGAPLVTPG